MAKHFFIAMGLMATVFATAQPKLPPNYYWQKLDNGLEVVVIENNKVPLATIEIAVKNGAYTEGPEYSGLSHLFEHMFFKANRDYPDQEKFVNRLNELGAIWNGTTNVERVNYFMTLDRDSLEPGLKFMNTAIRFPIYREEDMKKERPVVDGEFQRAESNPWFLLYQDVQKKLWGDLFTRKNPIGDHDIINTATTEKMMTIKDKYYYPNNSIVVVCGDVKKDKVFPMVRAIFGDWQPSNFDPFEKYPIPEFQKLMKSEYFVKESSIAQTPLLMVYWQGPDTRNDRKATYAADVFSFLLTLNSSKWTQALVDKGLATFTNVSYLTNKYVGPTSVVIAPNPDKMKQCYEEMNRQISMWANPDYFTDEQLADAKANRRRDYIRETEKPSSLSSNLTYWWCSADLDYFNDLENNYQKVTREDIIKYVKDYILDKPRVTGLIINSEMNKKYKPGDYVKY